jgi:pimeloyl-ACP methyl ester carboxylesterase
MGNDHPVKTFDFGLPPVLIYPNLSFGELAMPYVQIKDDTIYYTEQQRAATNHLLLVHGAGGDHTHWGNQLTQVKRVNGYAIDLPGHGRSNGTLRSTIADYADCVNNFLDVLGLDQVVITGHSMGGFIAQILTLSQPERIRGLILVSTAARLDNVADRFEQLQIDLQKGVSNLVDRGLSQWLLNRPEVLYNDFLVCNGFNVMSRLGEIACPTLIICGIYDKVTSVDHATFLHNNIRSSELVLIEDAGHMVMVDQAKAVSQAIEAFLTRCCDSP